MPASLAMSWFVLLVVLWLEFWLGVWFGVWVVFIDTPCDWQAPKVMLATKASGKKIESAVRCVMAVPKRGVMPKG